MLICDLGLAWLGFCFLGVAFTAREASFAPEKRRLAAALHIVLRRGALLKQFMGVGRRWRVFRLGRLTGGARPGILCRRVVK